MWKNEFFEEYKPPENRFSGESAENRLLRDESTDIKVAGCFDLAQNDAISPPQPLLPPIHPLVGLYQSEAKRKLASIEIILKRIHSKRKEFNSKDRWMDLVEQKRSLQELFTISEQGIKENRASMSRFYEIIKEERKHHRILENEKQLTKLRVGEYRKVQEQFTHYVKKYSIFEKYLESVAEIGEGWRNVRDILDRYETLKNTGLQCVKILENELQEAEDLRKQMVVLMEEKSAKLKKVSNKLILLEVNKKQSQDKRVYWEHMMQRIKNHVLDRAQETMSLNDGIHGLYRNMCHRRRVVPTIPSSNVQEQVEFIHKNILFYKEVVTLACSTNTHKEKKETVKVIKKGKTKEKKK